MNLKQHSHFRARCLLAQLSLVLLALDTSPLAWAQYPNAQPPPAELKTGFDRIQESDAKSILGYLAGPETQGRGTGYPGFQKAAKFVAARFKAAGLKPLGDHGTYFQNATFYRETLADIKMITPSGVTLDDRSVSLGSLGKDVDVTGGLVVLRASGRLTDDQKQAVRGKVIISIVPVLYGGTTYDAQNAGAIALLSLADGVNAALPRLSMNRSQGSFLTGKISRKAAAELGVPAGDKEEGTVILLADTVRITAKNRVEAVKVPNVVGMIEGSDPTLKAETVGVGAHLDHLGVNDASVVYPGADDDGSGSTAVILIAQAVAANPVKPRRSLVFMTFFGEELGLLGSQYLTAHPPVPLNKMVTELQMDMVGRDDDKPEENVDTLRLIGSKRLSTDLNQDIEEMNRYIGFRFKYDREYIFNRSDQYSFAKKDIPVAFLFDGFHPDYHEPTDTVDKIDWAKLTNAARLYYLTAMKIADASAAPAKDVKTFTGQGTYRLSPYGAPGSALRVPRVELVPNAFNVSSGNIPLIVGTADNGAAEKLNFVSLGGGLYKIQCSFYTTLVLEAGGTDDGAPVKVATDTGTSAQKWEVVDTGGGYFALKPLSSPTKALDNFGGRVGKNNPQVLRSFDATRQSQKWRFIEP